MSSVSISNDGKYGIVHLFSQEIHLWNLQTRKLEMQFHHKRSPDLVPLYLQACFGGKQDSFVISGSLGNLTSFHTLNTQFKLISITKDGNVFIWNKNGSLLEKLAAHSSAVNCVCWNRESRSMFASGGDDCIVKVWRPRK